MYASKERSLLLDDYDSPGSENILFDEQEVHIRPQFHIMSAGLRKWVQRSWPLTVAGFIIFYLAGILSGVAISQTTRSDGSHVISYCTSNIKAPFVFIEPCYLTIF